MKRVEILFIKDLKAFLVEANREGRLVYEFEGRPTVKHAVESLGVPHTEVQKFLANGEQVGFDYILFDGDQLEVHAFPPIAQEPEPDPRFLLDGHLGKLAAYLRMLSFDALYQNDYHDELLAQAASEDGRILLTRDRRLLMRSIIRRGYCLRSLEPKAQLLEVLRRYNLFQAIKPFQRCLNCNSLLKPVEKEAILDRLEPLTRLYYDEFRICPGCSKIYWKGSHYERMKRFIEKVTMEGPEA